MSSQFETPSDVLSLREVSLAYGDRRALDRVTLDVPRGAVIGLVGSNGAGKSTLIRAVLGLSAIDAGRIAILGENPEALSDSARARIGYVSQSPELIEWMTVQQHLDYIGAFYPTWDRALVERLRGQWQLPPDERIGQLSLGGKQKLGLLLALGHSPELLILDEPVASLDPLARREFMRTLFEGDKQRTVIISSHLLLDLQRVISHLAFVKEGRLVLFDEWDALIESLRAVTSPTVLPDGPGLLAQRSQGAVVRAVIDRRIYPATALPAAAESAAMNLDDLFVEMMS
jgi:ABC-2 type transport system ATP-binding protein